MTFPEISIIANTFERPWHLARCLRSLERQGTEISRTEVIVVDDGSQGPETFETVAKFAKRIDVTTTFITQPKNGFRLAKCRNKAVSIASAEQLVFLDGDCIVPADFLSQVSMLLEPRVAVACDSYRLTRAATEQVTPQAIDGWTIPTLIPGQELRRLFCKTLRAFVYQTLNVSMRPRLTGCAFALMKADLQRINGFDENFVGWGFEDSDLQRRLEQSGVRVKTALHRTRAVHLWHPLDPTFSKESAENANRNYFNRSDVPTYCQQGLDQYTHCKPPFTIFSSSEKQGSFANEIRYLQGLVKEAGVTS